MARRDASVQHHRLNPVVRLDRPARLFLCAGCRIQVVLCSRCDRGNRYCGRACWRLTRNVARRKAARRYQCSRPGRIAHAARSRRWRQRNALSGDDGHDSGTAHNVTHQGSHAGVLAAPLATCTHDTARSASIDHIAVAPAAPRHCHRCAAAQPDWLRQGFLRRNARAMAVPTGWRHDHSP